jgi:hypothetical protein
MQRLIIYNWLALSILSLLVAGYIALFEHFMKDKGYLFVLLAIIFGFIFYKQKKVHGL